MQQNLDADISEFYFFHKDHSTRFSFLCLTHCKFMYIETHLKFMECFVAMVKNHGGCHV